MPANTTHLPNSENGSRPIMTVSLLRTAGWWARKDLNLGPTDYESAALTAELRAPRFVNA